MSESIEIDNYDNRSRDASPRRDRAEVRDRSPRRAGDNYRERDISGGSGGATQSSRSARNYNNSIFVGNIPYDCTSNQLRELFGGVGNVIRSDIVTQNGRHRGMATVEFSSKVEVDKAIREFDHSKFLDREIFVRQDNPPPESRNDRFGGRDGYRGDRYGGRGGYRDEGYGGRGGYGDDRYGGRDGGYRDSYRDNRGGYRDDRYGDRGGYGHDRYSGRDSFRDERAPRREHASRTGPLYEVFVGNLPFRFKWFDLKDMFKEVGSVLRADVRTDYDGRSKGYGTVSFESAEDVQKAVEKFNGTEVDGRRIDVREGKNNSNGGASAASNPIADNSYSQQPKKANSEFTEGVEGKGEKNDTIFVDNLPYATSNDDLFELFESIGRVAQAEIKYDASGRPGTAVVKFESEDSAEAAVQKLNQYEYGERRLNISYARRP